MNGYAFFGLIERSLEALMSGMALGVESGLLSCIIKRHNGHRSGAATSIYSLVFQKYFLQCLD